MFILSDRDVARLADKIAADVSNSVGGQLHNIAVMLGSIQRRLNDIMATLNDIEADEAALKAGNKQLIQLVGNAVAEITALKSSQGIPADVQARLNALHDNLVSDLNDVTTELTKDGSAIDVPAAAPVPDTSGATGS